MILPEHGSWTYSRIINPSNADASLFLPQQEGKQGVRRIPSLSVVSLIVLMSHLSAGQDGYNFSPYLTALLGAK